MKGKIQSTVFFMHLNIQAYNEIQDISKRYLFMQMILFMLMVLWGS